MLQTHTVIRSENGQVVQMIKEEGELAEARIHAAMQFFGQCDDKRITSAYCQITGVRQEVHINEPRSS